LTLPRSTGPAEDQINRLKVVKRTMYGRAGFDLLRSRVMAADQETTQPSNSPKSLRTKK
jgi:transposase